MKKYFSVLLFSFSAATLAAAPIKTDVSAGYTYDDNVTRAERDQDIEKDNIFNIDASASYKLPVSSNSYFSLKGTLEASRYFDFSRLSNTRLGAHASYHIKPFSGYTATRFLVRAAYVRRLYDSDQRDGSATYLQLGLAKRLTDLLSLRAGYIKENIDSNSIVFDADNNRLYLDLDYRLNRNNTVYMTFAYLDGDLVTTAPDDLGIYYDYWVIDDAFTELTPTRWAYRLKGTAASFRLGNNYAIDHSQSVDGSVFYYDSESDSGITYSGLIINLNYLYRF